MGVTQSAGSLARAVGPSLAALLIHSGTAYVGADGVAHYMSDGSLFATFWAASAIMFITFLTAIYFASAYAAEFRRSRSNTAGAV